jgi:hypothetical protein
MKKQSIQPPKLLRNPHLQTLLPSLLTVRTQFPLQFRAFDVDSMQQFVLACRPAEQPRQDGVLLIIPGIEGGHHSPVAKLLKAAEPFRHHSIYTLSHRGIGTPNQQVTPYHAALTDDLARSIEFIRQRHPDEPIHAVGFSMGANLLLKYLSEYHGSLDLATAISTPFDISHSVNHTPLLYQKQLIKSLRHRANRGTATISGIDWSSIHSIRDFDQWVTAPYFGFTSADDYYEQSSCIHTLNTISCPTWLLSAADDPFVASSCWPKREQLPDNIKLIGTDNGGHMGFHYFDRGFHNWIAEVIAAQNLWSAHPHLL